VSVRNAIRQARRIGGDAASGRGQSANHGGVYGGEAWKDQGDQDPKCVRKKELCTSESGLEEEDRHQDYEVQTKEEALTE
jgi:hypothetical protein